MHESQRRMPEVQSFFDLATTAQQYDSKEVNWDIEGDGDDCIRRMLLEIILSQTVELEPGLLHADLGCGTGWLTEYMAGVGVISTGFDSSISNIRAASHRYPHANFQLIDFVSQDIGKGYDLVTANMSFEHVPRPLEALQKVNASMSQNGRFLLIFGDYDYFTKPRFDVSVELQDDGIENEVSVRTNYGGDFGVLYDVVRRPHVYEKAAREAGFAVSDVLPFAVPEWLVEERPEYLVQTGEIMFQMLIADM